MRSVLCRFSPLIHPNLLDLPITDPCILMMNQCFASLFFQRMTLAGSLRVEKMGFFSLPKLQPRACLSVIGAALRNELGINPDFGRLSGGLFSQTPRSRNGGCVAHNRGFDTLPRLGLQPAAQGQRQRFHGNFERQKWLPN